jgi:hypothetical protein
MEHFDACDARQVAAITRAVAQATMGQRVTFWVDQGMTHRTEEGKAVAVPNGTLSIHLYVNGGAVDEVIPVRPRPADAPPEAVS